MFIYIIVFYVFRFKICNKSTNARLRKDNAPYNERTLHGQQADISTASHHEAISKKRYAE